MDQEFVRSSSAVWHPAWLPPDASDVEECDATSADPKRMLCDVLWSSVNDPSADRLHSDSISPCSWDLQIPDQNRSIFPKNIPSEATTQDLEAVSTLVGYCLQNDTVRPRCDICKNYLTGGHYRVHPFWGQQYCITHEHDGTHLCCCCGRLLPSEDEYLLVDGRSICTQCRASRMIRNLNELQLLYEDIRQFFESMGTKVEQHIPISLVTRQAIDDASGGRRDGNNDKPAVQGLCCFETTIFRVVQVSGGIDGDRATYPDIVTLHRPTAILILEGLPRLLTGMILAHEMMHAWLMLTGYGDLPRDVEEGMCEVLGYMWLERELYEIHSRALRKGYTPGLLFDKKLGKFFMRGMWENACPTYGEGFRIGWGAVQKYGLRETLGHIWATGTFPC